MGARPDVSSGLRVYTVTGGRSNEAAAGCAGAGLRGMMVSSN
jgi:hypothetical protein